MLVTGALQRPGEPILPGRHRNKDRYLYNVGAQVTDCRTHSVFGVSIMLFSYLVFRVIFIVFRK